MLSAYAINVIQLTCKGLEIQSNSLKEIAKFCVLQIIKEIPSSVFVEDSGLFIKALNGFPGTYSSYVYQTLGLSSILKLLFAVDNRDAEFRSVVAFCSPEGKARCFEGVAQGKISLEVRGTNGFGFDPIFEPDGGGGKTFAEMSVEEKCLLSHRGTALRKFAEWYKNYVYNHTL